jgi:TPR repeat protein
MYLLRGSIPEDSKEALEYYRLAAEQGSAKAQLKIGLMYDEGKDLPQDYKEASR